MRRSDVYSLGCVLFERLSGARPFEGESELTVVFSHLNEPPPRLSDFRPELPPRRSTTSSGPRWQSTPDERYATCGELLAAARAALRGQGSRRRLRARRRRVVLAAGAVLVAAAAAALAGVLATRDSPPRRSHRRSISRSRRSRGRDSGSFV